MKFFNRAQPVIERVEAVFEPDVHEIFAQARQAALDANAEVTRLKAQLQDALRRARDLHSEAVDAAAAAAAQAEQDAQQLRAAMAAHAKDMSTQASQISDTAV
jgi:hypothetical protein